MTRSEFLKKVDEIVGKEPGSLREGDLLKNIEGWDSLAGVQFMALADESCGVAVPADAIARSTTVGSLLDLLGDKLER